MTIPQLTIDRIDIARNSNCIADILLHEYTLRKQKFTRLNTVVMATVNGYPADKAI